MFTAQKIFTDRESHQSALRKSLNELLGSKQKKILSFYGAGGQGKSALCNEFRKNILPKGNNNIAEVFSDFNISELQNSADCMEFIRKQLGDQLKKKFIAFDMAFIRYKMLTSNMQFVKTRYRYMFSYENDVVNDSVDVINEFASEIPGVRFVFNRLKSLGEKYYLEYLKSSEEILSHYNIDILDASKILEILPSLLAHDINRITVTKEKKILLVFDTYEKLWENSPSKRGYGADTKDFWLKSLYLKIEKNLLLIVFGRDKLRWDARIEDFRIEQHYVGRLSDNDCDLFLKNVPIKEKIIRDRITQSSEGLPFYLDLQVSIYQDLKNSNRSLEIERFGEFKEEVINRFFHHIGDNEKEIFKILAIPRNLDKAVYNYLRYKGFIPKHKSFDSIIEHSFYHKLSEEDENFQMHGLMKSWIESDIKKHEADLYKEVNELMFDYYSKKIASIQSSQETNELIDYSVTEALNHHIAFDKKGALEWILNLNTYLIQNYKLDLAENAYKKAIESVEVLEQDHLLAPLRELQFSLISIYLNRGKYEDAESLAEQVFDYLNRDQKLLQENDLSLSYNNSGIANKLLECLTKNNNYDKAKRINFEVNFGDTKSYRLKLLADKLGQSDLSESISWNFYFRKLYKENNWESSFIYHLLGHSNFYSKRKEIAKFFYEKSLDDYIEKYDPADKQTVINYAVSLYCLGRAHSTDSIELANKYLNESLGLYDDLVRMDHPYRIETNIRLIHNRIVQNGLKAADNQEIENAYKQLYQINPYEPRWYELTLELIELIYHLDPLLGNDVILMSMELLVFKYGKNFKRLIPFIDFCVTGGIELYQNNEEWRNDIIRLNEYQIRTHNLEQVDKEDPKYAILYKLLKDHYVIDQKEQYHLSLFNLPFYNKTILLQLSRNGIELYAFYFETKLYFIDASNEVFAQLSKDLILSSDQIASYAQLYFDVFIGASGRLFIINELNDLSWSSISYDKELLSDEVLDQIRPPQLISRTSEEVRIAFYFLIHQSSIFQAELLIKSNGIVSIENDKRIGDNHVEFEIIFPNSQNILSKLNLVSKALHLWEPTISEKNQFHEAHDLIKSSYKTLKILSQTPLSVAELERTPVPLECRKILKEKNGEHFEIDALTLTFCKDHFLIRLSDKSGVVIFYISDFKENFTLLNWTSNPFHILTKVDFIFNEITAKDYLKIFCDFLKGKNTRFSILEDSSLYSYSSLDGDQSKIETAKSLIKPIRLTKRGKDYFQFETQSMLAHSNLVKVVMRVKNNGTVQMLEDETLIENISIIPKEFESDIDDIVNSYNSIKQLFESLKKRKKFKSDFRWLPDMLIDNILLELKNEVEYLYEK